MSRRRSSTSHRHRPISPCAAIAALAVFVVGCTTGLGSASTELPSARTTPSTTAEVIMSPAETAPVTAGPTTVATVAPVSVSPSAASITLVGDDGVSIQLEGAPHKVVSLTPATSELMFALGAGDRLVGRTDYDDYPTEVAAVPVVATFEGVQIEKVVDIAPDLVLAGGNGFTHADDIQRMRDLGYRVLVLYAKDLDGVQADIELVGDAVGEPEAAGHIADAIEGRVDEVRQAVASLSKPRTFYEIGNEPGLYGPAPDSFLADEVELAGGDPITTKDPAAFEISLEELVAADPEVVILGDAAYGACPDAVMARPGWHGISAVKNGDVRPVDDTIVTRPGPRIGDGIAALALAIHPDADIAPPPPGAELCM